MEGTYREMSSRCRLQRLVKVMQHHVRCQKVGAALGFPMDRIEIVGVAVNLGCPWMTTQ